MQLNHGPPLKNEHCYYIGTTNWGHLGYCLEYLHLHSPPCNCMGRAIFSSSKFRQTNSDTCSDTVQSLEYYYFRVYEKIIIKFKRPNWPKIKKISKTISRLKFVE